MSEQDDTTTTDNLQQLREAADRGKQEAARAAALERELAFAKAQVDTDSPLGAMFAKAYDGELTAEAVKAAWAAVAPGNNQPAAPLTPTPEQLDETAARRSLTSGGAGDTPPEPPDVDPVAAGYEEYHKRLGAGERRETAAGSVFGNILAAAAQGDERVLVKPWTPEQLGR